MPSNPSEEEVLGLQRDLRDMRNALAAMRDRLEATQGEHEVAVVRAVSAAAAEAAMLRGTVTALREELETERARRDEAVTAAVAYGQDQIGQPKATVSALRESLERLTAS